jgi:hypothetical protein
MLRVLRSGSVVLAIAGLILLYLAVTHREIPVQNIGEITPLMNYAYVRLVGSVPRDAYVSEKNGGVDYVSFLVKDATGSIRVSAQREVAQELSDAGRLPKQGMQVSVSGSLNVGSDGPPKMRLQTARHLVIEEKK